MKKVLVLGAGGQIAHQVIDMLRGDKDVTLTLFLRNARKIGSAAPRNAHGNMAWAPSRLRTRIAPPK